VLLPPGQEEQVEVALMAIAALVVEVAELAYLVKDVMEPLV
jgi:hypothetical protein